MARVPQHQIYIVFDHFNDDESGSAYSVYLNPESIPENRDVYVYTNTNKGRVVPRKLELEKKA